MQSLFFSKVNGLLQTAGELSIGIVKFQIRFICWRRRLYTYTASKTSHLTYERHIFLFQYDTAGYAIFVIGIKQRILSYLRKHILVLTFSLMDGYQKAHAHWVCIVWVSLIKPSIAVHSLRYSTIQRHNQQG